MKTLEDLFEHQLFDLYSAEDQLINALPEMAENASDVQLKKAFEAHLKETENHKLRIEEICDALDIKIKREKCKAMEGLIKEAQSFLKEKAEKDVKDAGLIANAQRAEHYEISAYGTAVRYAKDLGHSDIAKKLQKTLDEEYGADEKLNKLAEGRINKKAAAG